MSASRQKQTLIVLAVAMSTVCSTTAVFEIPVTFLVRRRHYGAERALDRASLARRETAENKAGCPTLREPLKLMGPEFS
jgi:hypothetical protein